MESALFYTLSTIAQTLAGTLAIVLAVVALGLGWLRAEIRNDVSGLKEQAKKIRPRLVPAIGLSLLDVGFCFAALPFVPRIAPCAALAGVALFIAVAAGVACLVLYWLVMKAVIEVVWANMK